MKKKIFVCILTGALVMSLGTSSAYAARRNNDVDKSNNGVCNNSITETHFVDENGDGVCDNINTNPNFTDENNDGICDNKEVQSGHGRQNGCRGRRSR